MHQKKSFKSMMMIINGNKKDKLVKIKDVKIDNIKKACSYRNCAVKEKLMIK